jgi:hypothetical protein
MMLHDAPSRIKGIFRGTTLVDYATRLVLCPRAAIVLHWGRMTAIQAGAIRTQARARGSRDAPTGPPAFVHGPKRPGTHGAVRYCAGQLRALGTHRFEARFPVRVIMLLDLAWLVP